MKIILAVLAATLTSLLPAAFADTGLQKAWIDADALIRQAQTLSLAKPADYVQKIQLGDAPAKPLTDRDKALLENVRTLVRKLKDDHRLYELLPAYQPSRFAPVSAEDAKVFIDLFLITPDINEANHLLFYVHAILTPFPLAVSSDRPSLMTYGEYLKAIKAFIDARKSTPI